MFGDTALGWRAMSTLAGTATVLGVFAILMLLFGSIRTASYGALFAAMNCTLYVHARIAMLEPFLGAFVVAAGSPRCCGRCAAPPERVTRRWMLGAVLLGLATAVKWTAAPYVAFAAIAFLALRARRRRALAGASAAKGVAAARRGQHRHLFRSPSCPRFFYANEPLTLGRLIPFQLDMYRHQTQVLHAASLSVGLAQLAVRRCGRSGICTNRSMARCAASCTSATRRSCGAGWSRSPGSAWHWWRAAIARAGGVALLWAASLGIWAVIPKSLGFYYYYHLSGIFAVRRAGRGVPPRATRPRDGSILVRGRARSRCSSISTRSSSAARAARRSGVQSLDVVRQLAVTPLYRPQVKRDD